MKTKAPLCLALSALLASCAGADTIINFDDLPQVTGNTSQYGNWAPLPNPTNYEGFQFQQIAYFTGTNSFFVGVNSNPNAGVIINPTPTISLASGRTFNFISAYITYADPTMMGPGSGAPLEVFGLDSHNNPIEGVIINPTLTPTNFQFNFTGISAIGFYAQWFTALDDIDVQVLAPVFASIPNLNANQRGVASSIDQANLNTPTTPSVAQVVTALGSLPVTVEPGALDELMPSKTARFFSQTAFNNATFEVQDMDDMFAEDRGPRGNFTASTGGFDASHLVINDPNVDPALQMLHSRMLAWDAPVTGISDVPNPALGGIDMKQMKPCPMCGGEKQDSWDVFLRGNVILGQGFTNGDVPHYGDNTESVVAGADYRFSEHFLAGLTASYAHTDATLDNLGSSATVDSYSPGLYASYADSGWYANFIGRYSYNTYTTDRAIAFLGQTANGDTTGNEGLVDLDGGYDFHSGPWTYGPVAGLQYTHLTVNGYTERNSDAALAVNEDQSDSLRSRLGGEARLQFHYAGIGFQPHVEATWVHEFMDQSRGITSQFTQFSGGSFTVHTPKPSPDSALIDFGLDAQVNDDITAFADYVVETGNNAYFGQSVQAGVKVSF